MFVIPAKLKETFIRKYWYGFSRGNMVKKFKQWHFEGDAKKFTSKYGKDAICVIDGKVYRRNFDG